MLLWLSSLISNTEHPFWPLEIQRRHAAPVWPSRPLSTAWGVDTVPSKTPGRSALLTGCVQRSHTLPLWDDSPSAGRTPAQNITEKRKGRKQFQMNLCWYFKQIIICTSVQRMIFPFSLYSDFWNIFVLLMDSMDFPSMGLITLRGTNTHYMSVIDDIDQKVKCSWYSVGWLVGFKAFHFSVVYLLMIG